MNDWSGPRGPAVNNLNTGTPYGEMLIKLLSGTGEVFIFLWHEFGFIKFQEDTRYYCWKIIGDNFTLVECFIYEYIE